MDAQEQEVQEITTLEPIAEAAASDVVQAEAGCVVAATSAADAAEVLSDGVDGASVEGSADVVSSATVEDSDASDAEALPDAVDTIAVEVSADTEISHEDHVPPHKNGQLKNVIQCMLFVSDEPLSSKQIAETLEMEEDRVREAVEALDQDLSESGIQLARIAGCYQLCTKPEYADYCTMILAPAKRKLSKAALETLAVVAYRQPCTIPEVEAVRGVDVGGVMRTLGERGLVKEAGRKQAPGRPVLYATTPEFLEYFGLNDISELPDIDMLAVEEVKALQSQRELFARPVAADESATADTPAAHDEPFEEGDEGQGSIEHKEQ